MTSLQTRDGIDAHIYGEKFPAIHFNFNWQAFAAQDWPVSVHRICERADLLALRTAFRRRFGRFDPRFIKTVFSHYATVGEALVHVDTFKPRRQAIIEGYREQFAAHDGVVELELPVYRIRNGYELILDGNHRACALALTDVPFHLTLYTIDGPRRYRPR